MSDSIAKPDLITERVHLWNGLTTRKHVTLTRHSIATLIQLEYIIFRIHELNDVAVYNPKNHTLIRKDIKELVEPYIFPILSNSEDDKKIKGYFEVIYFDELQNFNKKAYSPSGVLDIAVGKNEIANNKIMTQKVKQEVLKEFYNVY